MSTVERTALAGGTVARFERMAHSAAMKKILYRCCLRVSLPGTRLLLQGAVLAATRFLAGEPRPLDGLWAQIAADTGGDRLWIDEQLRLTLDYAAAERARRADATFHSPAGTVLHTHTPEAVCACLSGILLLQAD